MPVTPASGEVKAQDHEFKVIFCYVDNLANWDTVSKWKPRQKLKTKINLVIFLADAHIYQEGKTLWQYLQEKSSTFRDKTQQLWPLLD